MVAAERSGKALETTAAIAMTGPALFRLTATIDTMLWAQMEAHLERGLYPRLPRVLGRKSEPEAPIPEASCLDPNLAIFARLRRYERLQIRQLKALASMSVKRIKATDDAVDVQSSSFDSDPNAEETAWGIAQADFDAVAQDLRDLLDDVGPIPVIPDSRLGPLSLSRNPAPEHLRAVIRHDSPQSLLVSSDAAAEIKSSFKDVRLLPVLTRRRPGGPPWCEVVAKRATIDSARQCFEAGTFCVTLFERRGIFVSRETCAWISGRDFPLLQMELVSAVDD